MKLLRLFIVTLLFPVFDLSAQSATSTGAGTKPFSESGGRKFWMGANYRKEWNTKVTVPIIDLSKEFGGLKPVKLGGGKQTRSLRMEDPNGREYSLRSVQKFITSKTLPGDLQSEAAADLVSDGVSASYPYSNLSIGVLSDAARIPHGEVKLVYVGDDPALGEYRKDFANMLALLEIRLPDSVKKGHDTEDVAEKLKDDNDNEVDQLALLKARILDMFVMDLDRHEDQWQWGTIDKDKGKIYFPIPRDRDQAFYKNQGLLPGIVKWPWLVPQLQGFRPKAKDIRRFNFAARNLDRFFLTELDEDDWKRAVEEFKTQMTDAVIEKALNEQPPEIKPISAPEIIQILKERRDKYLVDEVMEYYRFISEDVNITTSDKTELFDITINDNGSVLLQIFKITKEGEQSNKIFERTFNPAHTKELRIYGFGGNDKYVLRGREDKIKIRLIGGEGSDSYENLTSSGETGIVYDVPSEKNTIKGEFKDKMREDTISHHYDRLGYNYNQNIPFVAAGYNQDDGVFIGGFLRMVKHGFRKEPFKNSHNILFTYAFSTGASRFAYVSEYIGTFGRNSDLLIGIDLKAPNNVTNFFGYGMSSEYDKEQPGRFKFYRARYQLGDIGAFVRTNISRKVTLTYGPVFHSYRMKADDKFNEDRYISDASNGLDPTTLFTRQNYLGGRVAFNVDTRDNLIMPQKGIYWLSQVRHLSGLGETPYKVTQLNSDFTLIFQLIKNRLVIAERFGGGHNFGDFEFYQAQYLGSEDNLRGYRKYRFAGRSKIYNNIEMRLRVANFKTYLFPGSLGILGFYDTGHVWADEDNSTKWASGYGGGFWISPLRRIVLTVTFTTSTEDKMALVAFGWKF